MERPGFGRISVERRDRRRYRLILRHRCRVRARRGHRGRAAAKARAAGRRHRDASSGSSSAPRCSASRRPTTSSSSSPTSASGCCSSSPATRSTSSGSGRAAEARRARLAALARARLRDRRRCSPPPAIVLSLLFTGSAMATTAIGTLIPILRDGGELQDPLRHLPARRRRARRVRPDPADHARSLDHQPAARGGRSCSRSSSSRSSLALTSVRYASAGLRRARADARGRAASSPSASPIVLVFGLVLLAAELGLDLLLGGFVAGMIVRARASRPRARGLRVEADRGRLRLPDPVLLRRQRDQVRPRRARLARRARQDGPLPRPVPGRPGGPGAAALPQARSTPATGSRSPSSRPPSCRWSSRSRRSRSTPAR